MWGLKVAELDWKAVKRRAESKVSLFNWGKFDSFFKAPWPVATGHAAALKAGTERWPEFILSI